MKKISGKIIIFIILLLLSVISIFFIKIHISEEKQKLKTERLTVHDKRLTTGYGYSGFSLFDKIDMVKSGNLNIEFVYQIVPISDNIQFIGIAVDDRSEIKDVYEKDGYTIISLKEKKDAEETYVLDSFQPWYPNTVIWTKVKKIDKGIKIILNHHEIKYSEFPMPDDELAYRKSLFQEN
jgi:hypothetical protein